MSSIGQIPTTHTELWLKQHRPGDLEDWQRDILQFFFPLFLSNAETEASRSVVSIPADKPRDEVFLPDGSPRPEYIFVMDKRPRRYAGDCTLGRGRYHVLAKNATGYDDGTLLNELGAYLRDDLPHPIHLVDLCFEENGYFPPQPAIFIILGSREHLPAEIQAIIESVSVRPSKHAFTVMSPSGPSCAVRIPYKVERQTLENIVDLRLPETQQWFWQAFGVERFHCFSFGAKIDNAAMTRTMRAAHKESFPSPDSFVHMLPGLLGQGLGDENGVTQAIGTWLRVNDVAGLVFPSARMDCACLLWDGQFSDFRGWNFVDYRETPTPTVSNVIVPDGNWPGFDGFPKVGVVIATEGRNLGSWRVKGLCEWQTRERNMVIGSRIKGGRSATLAHGGETDAIEVESAPDRKPGYPAFRADEKSLSAPPILDATKFKAGPDWFLFKPGGQCIDILCPSCRWGDVWDRGDEQPPEACPRCGFPKDK